MADERHRAAATRTLGLLDLTSLGDDDGPSTVDRLCADAATPHGSVASVCLWPRFVARAATALAGTGVAVCAVADFPGGEGGPTAARSDARRIVADGGSEVDVVIPWRSLAAGGRHEATAVVAAVRDEVGEAVTVKAILETGELADPDLIAVAAAEAVAGGADFLKTSTGKTAHSASLDAVRILLGVVADDRGDRRLGVKVSGGVRDLETAERYLALADELMGPDWVEPATFRFGASGLLGALLSVLDVPDER